MTVKNELIKIAYENPELRAELLPVINKLGSKFDPKNLAPALGELARAKNELQAAYKQPGGKIWRTS